jgi:small-conductance mechanosensitive channel
VVLCGAVSADDESAADSQTSTGQPNGQLLIDYLNQSIDWYRHLAVEESSSTDPADLLFINDNRQMASQIVRQSFDFGRAAAQLIAAQTPQNPTQNQANSRFQTLVQATAKTDQVVHDTQIEIDQLQDKLASAASRDRPKLQATLDELKSELALAQARSEALHNILQFASLGAAGASGGNLVAQVQELQRSVPEATLNSQPSATSDGQANGQAKGSTTAAATSATASAQARRQQPEGLLALVADLFSLTRKIRTIDDSIKTTNALAQTAQNLRTPIVKHLSGLVQRGNALAQQADTSDVAGLQQQKRELDGLTAQFKQTSSLILPLSKQSVLLDLYKSSLMRWRDDVKTQYQIDLKNLGLRLLVLTVVLGGFFILAELWKRATFRYVHDFRRRYQFLLLRRILLWFVVAITIAFALATEIGSLATFAGLITAGIAVALQNVILAVAGYFFLIGRYGVRVGDRVQISGVTGDVLDIGLVRIHLMEMGGTGNYIQPTGRVVVFSNSIVFQPTASFYKQIPGTNFVWHHVSLTLAPDSDFQLAETRLLGAVEKVFLEYKDQIEREYKHMQAELNVRTVAPKPVSRLRLAQGGLEVVIRYPVELENAAEIDDHITRELLAALAQEPRLRLVGSGTPNIQAVPTTNGATAAHEVTSKTDGN